MVSDKDFGRSLTTKQVRREAPESFSQFKVEVTEGFVQQEQPGLWREGAGESDSLGFSPGELVGEALSKPAKVYLFKELVNPLIAFAASPVAEPIGDIARDRQMGEEIAALRNEPYLTVLRTNKGVCCGQDLITK